MIFIKENRWPLLLAVSRDKNIWLMLIAATAKKEQRFHLTQTNRLGSSTFRKNRSWGVR